MSKKPIMSPPIKGAGKPTAKAGIKPIKPDPMPKGATKK